jgi:hypothetical protein
MVVALALQPAWFRIAVRGGLAGVLLDLVLIDEAGRVE